MCSDLSFLDDKRILVTGGSGTVGYELVETLALRTHAKAIRVLANDENGLYCISSLLNAQHNLRFLLGDVRDKARLIRAFEEIDVVFHLAALKHVDLSEYNPFESVNTNVIGTENVIEAAIANNVEKVILTSSDKAANPSSVLGASKLLAEKLITAANIMRGQKKTIFSSVRFGNVLGSRGSVLHLIKQQLQYKKRVSLTHPDMTRFIMHIEDANNLLLRTAHLMQGGEVFVFKMHAVKIIDLFSTILEHLSDPNKDNFDETKFDIIGSRPGEKLHEDLYTEEESCRTLELSNMYVIIPNIPDLTKNLTEYYVRLGAKIVPIATYSSKHAGNILDKKGISELISDIKL